jgi:hypothetical protein
MRVRLYERKQMLEELNKFIQSNPDVRELKRAVAVQMYLKGFKHWQIGESLVERHIIILG